jgi:outer membrane lipoprotein SlyB
MFEPKPVLPWSRRHPSSSEGGSVTVFAAAVLTVLGLTTFFVLRLAAATTERARAQAAADASALAGAADGRDAAVHLASRNGATLEVYREVGNDVTVVVSVGQATATAIARHGDFAADYADPTTTVPT